MESAKHLLYTLISNLIDIHRVFSYIKNCVHSPVHIHTNSKAKPLHCVLSLCSLCNRSVHMKLQRPQHQILMFIHNYIFKSINKVSQFSTQNCSFAHHTLFPIIHVAESCKIHSFQEEG